MTDSKISNGAIIDFLSKVATEKTTFVEGLKIKYRPVICPFDDLVAYVEDGDRVYDIGCGQGQFAALLYEFTPAATIKGIEISKRLVGNANDIKKRLKKQKNKEMKFAVFDGNTLPQDIEDYDLVYMVDVFHHIPVGVRQNFMKQVYDNMKPGAKLVFKDMNAGSGFIPFNKLHDLVFAGEFPHEISHRNAENLLMGLGFKIIDSYTKQLFVYPHYVIVAQK